MYVIWMHTLFQIARYEFAFGAQYANNLLIFAITMAFSLSCPIIVPCGMLVGDLCYYHTVDALMSLFLRFSVLCVQVHG